MYTYLYMLVQIISSNLIITGLVSKDGFVADVFVFFTFLSALLAIICLCVILFDKERLDSIINEEPTKYYPEASTSTVIFHRILYILFSYAVFVISGNIILALVYFFIMLCYNIETVKFIKNHEMNS